MTYRHCARALGGTYEGRPPRMQSCGPCWAPTIGVIHMSPLRSRAKAPYERQKRSPACWSLSVAPATVEGAPAFGLTRRSSRQPGAGSFAGDVVVEALLTVRRATPTSPATRHLRVVFARARAPVFTPPHSLVRTDALARDWLVNPRGLRMRSRARGSGARPLAGPGRACSVVRWGRVAPRSQGHYVPPVGASQR